MGLVNSEDYPILMTSFDNKSPDLRSLILHEIVPVSIRCSRVTQYQTVTNIFYYFSSKVPRYCSYCVKKNLVVFSDLFWIINTRCNPCRIDYINKTNTTILSSNEGYLVFLIHHVLHHKI